MLIRDVAHCAHERVIDRSLLCELLHPDKVAGAAGLGCSVAHAIILAGEATLSHILKESTELYYILEGTGEMHIGPEHAPVRSGQLVLIPRVCTSSSGIPVARTLSFSASLPQNGRQRTNCSPDEFEGSTMPMADKAAALAGTTCRKRQQKRERD
jgi:mannose-6-phosphate isomerase-like protein (cupin superfamily)